MSYYLIAAAFLLFLISAVSSETWEITVDNAKVICHAKTSNWCPELEEEEDEWSSSDGLESYPQWVTEVDGNKIECLADDAAACPDLNGQSTPWRSNKQHSLNSEDKFWEINVNNVGITCSAQTVRECQESIKVRGKWHRTNESPVESAKWFHVNDRTQAYCDADSSMDCPKLLKGKWAKHHVKVRETREGKNVWIIKRKGATISCLAIYPKACPKLKKGPSKWKFEKSGHVDFGSQWSTVVGDTIVLCKASKISKCPKFFKQSKNWSEIAQSKPVPEGTWKIVIPSTTITCHSNKASQCRAEGGLMNKTNDDLSKSAKWFTTKDGAKYYCVSKYSSLCPNVFGQVWKENVKYKESANKEINVWVVNTLPGNLLCLAKHVKDCPQVFLLHFLKQKWMPKRTTLIELGAFNWKTFINRTPVLCSSLAAILCPYMSGHPYQWTRIEETSGIVKSHVIMWKMTVPELTITCQAENVRLCQQSLNIDGEWEKDNDETVPLAQWLNVKGGAKFYCDAERSNKCPNIYGSMWRPNPKYTDLLLRTSHLDSISKIRNQNFIKSAISKGITPFNHY